MGGRTAASDHDTQAILKMTSIPPVGGDSIDHLRRLEIVGSICLPEDHGFLVWVQQHIKKFNNFCLHWTGLEIQDPTLQHVKDVVHLHYLKLRLSRFFKHQRKTAILQPMEATDHLMSHVQDSNIAWAPPLSMGLQKALGIALRRVCQSQAPWRERR